MFCLGLLALLYIRLLKDDLTLVLSRVEKHPARRKPNALVLAKTSSEDVAWAYALKPHWKPYIYTSDKEPGYRPIPANKAREGMAYLTHIIEHYDYLADVTAFMHASATQWHNDVGDMASSSLLQKLSLDAVNKAGYANLRCEHRPGCPVAVRPFDPAMESNHNVVYRNFTSIYMDMFSVPREQVPTEIGGVCCGQFVLTRDRIRERPRDDYVRIRDWALATDMDNFAAGSVFEMLWHIIFLEQPVSCPDVQQCYCELYAMCPEIDAGS
ncbi:similar to An14g03060 [Aspergillus luchuensis IFO 4308]|nr:similar to An14g03060 [Aspergillus luchuensis IFO 4308]